MSGELPHLNESRLAITLVLPAGASWRSSPSAPTTLLQAPLCFLAPVRSFITMRGGELQEQLARDGIPLSFDADVQARLLKGQDMKSHCMPILALCCSPLSGWFSVLEYKAACAGMYAWHLLLQVSRRAQC